MYICRRLTFNSNDLQIITDKYHLYYDKKPFSPNGLSVQVKGNVTQWHSKWRYAETRFHGWNLNGTARTLDEADGRIPLEPGVVSKNGFAEINDSASMLFTEDGWIASRRPAEKGYVTRRWSVKTAADENVAETALTRTCSRMAWTTRQQ